MNRRRFLWLGGLALLVMCICVAGLLLTCRYRTPRTNAPIPLADLFTRVPFTPPAPLAPVPATYTPNPLTPQSNDDAVGTLRPTALPSPSPSFGDSANLIEASATASRAVSTPSGGAAPTATAEATATTAKPEPTTAPTPTGAPEPTRAPTVAATPAPTTTPIPQPTVVARNPKKGIGAAFAWAFEDGHEPFHIGWYYTWSLYPGAWASEPELEFIPMWPCHGTVDYVVGLLGADYDGYLLIINEPERPDQCTMTIDEAARYYLTVRDALPNARLIGPHVIERNAGGDFTWYTAAWRERVRQLTGSYPDVVGYGVHIYPYYSGSGTASQVLTSWCNTLNAWGEVGEKELWITEFGVHNFDGSPDQVRAQVRQMVDVFENGVGNCDVTRYAYFTDRRTNVDAANPTPTIEPVQPAYFDLYWRNSWLLSYTGEAYRDVGNR